MIYTEDTKANADERLRTVLREAEERHRHELMDDDQERQLLEDRIRRIRRRLGL